MLLRVLKTAVLDNQNLGRRYKVVLPGILVAVVARNSEPYDFNVTL